MKLSINKYSIPIALITLVFLMPELILRNYVMLQITRTLKATITICVILYYILNRRYLHFTTEVTTIIIYYLYIIIVSIFNRELPVNTLVELSFILLIYGYSASRRINIVRILATLLMILIGVNLITVIIFPKGMYQNGNTLLGQSENWFLGYKNTPVRMMIPALALTCIDNRSNRLVRIIAYFICAATVLLSNTATGIIGILVFGILILICKYNSKFQKWITITRGFLIYIVFDFIFIYLKGYQHIAMAFSKLIINILHRKLSFTGRNEIWDAAVKFSQKYIVFGVGEYNENQMTQIILATHPHNYMLNTLFTGGIVGLVLLIISYVNLDRILKDRCEDSIKEAITVAYISFFFMGIAESLTGTIMLYSFFAMTRCIDNKYNGKVV